MVRKVVYSVEIFCQDDSLSHVIADSYDFAEIQDLFMKLCDLDLPVAIHYDSWCSTSDEVDKKE